MAAHFLQKLKSLFLRITNVSIRPLLNKHCEFALFLKRTWLNTPLGKICQDELLFVPDRNRQTEMLHNPFIDKGLPQEKKMLTKMVLAGGYSANVTFVLCFFSLQQLPVVTSSTIVRCRSCRTYINPFVSFLDQRRWKCNLCYRVNDGMKGEGVIQQWLFGERATVRKTLEGMHECSKQIHLCNIMDSNSIK